MATPRSRQAARLRARQRRAQQRARRIALLAILAVAGVATALLTAFGSGRPDEPLPPIETASVSADGSVRPRPVPVARVGNLLIRLPVAVPSVTAIGYHGADDAALALQPVGRQANEGVLERLWRRIAGARRDGPRWYQLEGPPGTEVLVVGAAFRTDVFSPADGTIISITDRIVNGKTMGSRIDIRPTGAPSVTLSLINVKVDPALVVGLPVLASTSKLGTVVDVASVERQSLARHGADRGNNVTITVYPSPGALP